jgi:hypothetical protein
MSEQKRQLVFTVSSAKGVARGLTAPGRLLLDICAPAPRKVEMRERYLRTDRDAIREDVRRVGQTMSRVLVESKPYARSK